MKPNIILIISDQHNTSKEAETPNLDSLAKQGTNFTDCYCSSPLCVPSRAGMLSGRLSSKTGVWNNVQSLRSDEATFVHSLACNGYETVRAGRMHFMFNDQRHGYETRLVGEICPTFPRPQRQKDLYGVLAGTPDQSYKSIRVSGSGQSAVTVYDHDVTTASCDFIANRIDERPLFLTVGLYGPHCPFVAPKGLYDTYFERFKDIEFPKEYDRLHPEMKKFIDLRKIQSVSDEDYRRVVSAYYANVEYMDGLIGNILESIDEHLDRENTIIIYTSDHGESLGAHGLFWKSNFYEESVKVPLIVSWPGNVECDVENNNLVSLLDIAPTLIDITQSPELPEVDGISLTSLLEDSKLRYDRSVISQLIDIKGDAPSAMIRQGAYKLISFCNNDLPLLFNLETDPIEQCNLAEDPTYAAVCRTLQDELSKNWDASKALQTLRKSKIHASLIKRWVAETCPDCPEEWPADPAMNYLDTEI